MRPELLSARYLDGELSRAEADRLTAALAADPGLAADLASQEAALCLLVETPCGPPDPAGVERIMAAVHARPVVRRPRRRPRRSFAWAAALALAFGIGWVGATWHPHAPDGPDTDVRAGPPPFGRGAPAAATPAVRCVRLVFRPAAADAPPVGVAGTFNGWDATRSPFHREDGAWVAWLVLPPAEYEYVFVLADGRWVPDPAADRTRNDGFGHRNSVLELDL